MDYKIGDIVLYTGNGKNLDTYQDAVGQLCKVSSYSNHRVAIYPYGLTTINSSILRDFPAGRNEFLLLENLLPLEKAIYE